MKDYHIEFSRVRKGARSMVATRVSIGSEIITEETGDMDISLSSHPLYPKLEEYVLANPSGKNRK